MERHWDLILFLGGKNTLILAPELPYGTRGEALDSFERFNRKVSVHNCDLHNVLHCLGTEKLAISSQPETVLSLETKS